MFRPDPRRTLPFVLLCLVSCGIDSSIGPILTWDLDPLETTVEFSAETTGPGADRFVYLLAPAENRTLLLPDSVVEGVGQGAGIAELIGIPSHCEAGRNPVEYVRVPGVVTKVRFSVRCDAPGPLPVAAVTKPAWLNAILGVDEAGASARLLDFGESPAWSNDGTRLAFLKLEPSGTSHLQLFDPATGTSSVIGVRIHPFSRTVAWDNADRTIAHGDGYGTIRIQPVDGGLPMRLSPGLGSITDFAWSPGGDSLVVAGEFGVALIAANTGSSPALIEGDAPARNAKWSPGGGAITYIDSNTGSLFIARTDGSAPKLLAASVYAYAWSPDGSRLAYQNGAGVTHVVSPDGSAPGMVFSISGQPSWTRDGRLRVVGDAIHTIPLDGGPMISTGAGSMLTLLRSESEWR